MEKDSLKEGKDRMRGIDYIPMMKWMKRLYEKCFQDLLKELDMTQMEMDVVLFLANNPQFDKASDIVEVRGLTKSHVSMSIKELVKRGYLRQETRYGNKKVQHLVLQEKAHSVVERGRNCQEKFSEILWKGFSREEKETLDMLMKKGWENIRAALEKES